MVVFICDFVFFVLLCSLDIFMVDLFIVYFLKFKVLVDNICVVVIDLLVVVRRRVEVWVSVLILWVGGCWFFVGNVLVGFMGGSLFVLMLVLSGGNLLFGRWKNGLLVMLFVIFEVLFFRVFCCEVILLILIGFVVL